MPPQSKFQVSFRSVKTGALLPSQKLISELNFAANKMKRESLACFGRELVQRVMVLKRALLMFLLHANLRQEILINALFTEFLQLRLYFKRYFSIRQSAASEVEHPLLTWQDLMQKLWSVQLAPVHAQVPHHQRTQFAIHQVKFPQVAQLHRSNLSQITTKLTWTVKLG